MLFLSSTSVSAGGGWGALLTTGREVCPDPAPSEVGTVVTCVCAVGSLETGEGGLGVGLGMEGVSVCAAAVLGGETTEVAAGG